MQAMAATDQIPGVLVAVVGATAAVGAFGLADRYDLSVVGPLPRVSQPRAIPSTEPDGLGSGRRIIRNELNSPMRPARIGTSRAT
jgi:MFS superfamily sulfate permease-like transporter